jgi:N utilization substance protein B
MSLRSKSREFAMQMIFQWDSNQQTPARLEAKFWKSAKAADTTRAFANRLLEGTIKELAVLDPIITKHADNWKFERLSSIDRAILRLGVYELRFSDTPFKVVMNECVELAKKFSSEDAGGFVNGILDAVHKETASAAIKADSAQPTSNAATEQPASTPTHATPDDPASRS